MSSWEGERICPKCKKSRAELPDLYLEERYQIHHQEVSVSTLPFYWIDADIDLLEA